MKKWFHIIGFFICTLFVSTGYANDKVLNVYTWSNYIAPHVIAQFEKETGIQVNLSYYDSNEILYAKLASNQDLGYDFIIPSSYFVSRMRADNMLHKLDKNRLPNRKYYNPALLNLAFDPGNNYSYPFAWGATGIVYNEKYIKPGTVTSWVDLWQPQFKDQLLLLNDVRDVFSIALLTLGYSINTTNPQQIEQAFLHLKKLLPNVKLFNNDAERSIYVDEDAWIGMGWNGAVYAMMQENPAIRFVYPKDGFAIWIDTMAIPKNAPHLDNAYQFLNFLMRPDIAKVLTLEYGYSSPNAGAVKLMPEAIRQNTIINPTPEMLKNAQTQNDVGSALAIYQHYWELLKISS